MEAVVFHPTDFDPTYGIPSPRNFVHEWTQLCNAFGIKNIVIIDHINFKLGNYYKNKISQENFEWLFLESNETFQVYSKCTGPIVLHDKSIKNDSQYNNHLGSITIK